MSKDTPLTISVEGDELVMRIGLDTLAYAAEQSDVFNPYDETTGDFRREWSINDKVKFAKGVISHLQDESEDGSTHITCLLDAGFVRAIEDDSGVDEVPRVPAGA